MSNVSNRNVFFNTRINYKVKKDLVTGLDSMRQWQRITWILYILGFYDNTIYLSHVWRFYENTEI